MVILHVVAWLAGWLAPLTSNSILFLYPLWQWGTFAIITYQDSISSEALSTFSTLLDISPEALQRLRYEFTTLPAGRGIISGLFWACFFIVAAVFFLPGTYAALGANIISMAVIFAAGLLSFSTGSIIYYHSIRQLSLVYRTVNSVKHFDLFHLDPVYAFSKVTSRTGIAWVVLLTLTLLTFPVELAPVPTLLLAIAMMVLAISAFVLPLWSVNHRLVLEKRGLIAEHDRRVKMVLARLHECIERDDLSKAQELDHGISALNAEREILNKIPTWPWRSGLLPGFLSVIGLPVFTFIIQLAIGKWLGK